MPLPDDIQLATITLEVPTSFLGRTVTTSLKVTPSHNLTWAATGEALPAFTEAVTIAEDGSASCQLPYVDQAGFLNSKGQAFTMWAYTFSGMWSTDDGQVLKFQKSIQPLTGQPLIDLGVVPDGSISFPVAAAIPTVLSVAGNTGAVSGAQILADTTVAAALTAKLNASQKGAASGVAALGSDSKLLEENIPERLTDGELSATFVPGNPTLVVTYNPDGSVASTTENGVLTTFTYNPDGTVNTQTRAGVTKTFTYDANGNVTGAA